MVVPSLERPILRLSSADLDVILGTLEVRRTEAKGRRGGPF